jgi:hypothetical protein
MVIMDFPESKAETPQAFSAAPTPHSAILPNNANRQEEAAHTTPFHPSMVVNLNQCKLP